MNCPYLIVVLFFQSDNTQDFEKERLKLNREAARIAMQDVCMDDLGYSIMSLKFFKAKY